MAFLNPKPKVVEVEKPVPMANPPAPERTATETAALAEEQRRQFATNQKGRAATVLMGGSGGSGGVSALRFLRSAGV